MKEKTKVLSKEVDCFVAIDFFLISEHDTLLSGFV